MSAYCSQSDSGSCSHNGDELGEEHLGVALVCSSEGFKWSAKMDRVLRIADDVVDCV